MKNAKIIPNCICLFSFFTFICLLPVNADASKDKNRKWSFEFQNCTVTEALKKISDTADIEIITNYSDAEVKLNKSYDSKNIEKIINDLFKKENCAIVWLYDKDTEKLNGVKILVFESSEEIIRNKNLALKTNPGTVPGPPGRTNNPNSDFRNPRVFPSRKTIPSRQAFSRPIKTRQSSPNSDFTNQSPTAGSSASASVSSASSTSYYYTNKESNVEKIVPVAVQPRSSNIHSRSESRLEATQRNNER